jgi:hypothetical protein
LEQHVPSGEEILPPTRTYNCFGYALAHSHAEFGEESEYFIRDDFREIDHSEVRVEDVVIYRLQGELRHGAIVDRVSGGQIRAVRSKFGYCALARHRLSDVPPWYGHPAQFLRRLARARHVTESGALTMAQESLSAVAIESALARLSDPEVNVAVDSASTSNVAKEIIKSLPGVQQLMESGPEAAQAVRALLQSERTLEDANLTAICLHILASHPSDEVKLALAKPITERKFRGINAQLAAETFLKAAGIEATGQDAIETAMAEAQKIVQSLAVTEGVHDAFDDKRPAREE